MSSRQRKLPLSKVWDATWRALGETPKKEPAYERRPFFIPSDQRSCRNCKHGRNVDRRDRDDPWFVCRLDEQARQSSLFGGSCVPEREATYCCERWASAHDE
ncbi:hypothetical protein SAMN04488038_108192 [Solimonas aquatica]|uniref:Uncharacterized protein n=1 Tax=Solimonas aquatica TaxID=489703 RepID=A0A1H9HIQ8_9GAMM|nr:hypothetical protein [Solimonas aquatica]SEQ62205.1 hypothetical protein SAMN04488038_108192 [Solimonas aquatica]